MLYRLIGIVCILFLSKPLVIAQNTTPSFLSHKIASTSSALVSGNRHPLLLTNVPFNSLFSQLADFDVEPVGDLTTNAYDPVVNSAFFMGVLFSLDAVNSARLVGAANNEDTEINYAGNLGIMKFNLKNFYFQFFSESSSTIAHADTSRSPNIQDQFSGISAAYLPFQIMSFGISSWTNKNTKKEAGNPSRTNVNKILEASLSVNYYQSFYGSLQYTSTQNTRTNSDSNSWSNFGLGLSVEGSNNIFNNLRYEVFYEISQESIVEGTTPANNNIHQKENNIYHTLEMQIGNFVMSYTKSIQKYGGTELGGQYYPERTIWADKLGIMISTIGNFSRTTIELMQKIDGPAYGPADAIQEVAIGQGFVF